MVRTGIGNFNISDFDIYEPANINRQFGARVPDLGRPKMEVMKEQAKSINPFINISEFSQGIDKSNVDDFLDGVSVVIDSLDFFAFETRRMIFKRAREKGYMSSQQVPSGLDRPCLFLHHPGEWDLMNILTSKRV